MIRPFEELSCRVLKVLREAGFVHVTGLPIVRSSNPDVTVGFVCANEDQLGRYDSHDSEVVLVTLDGQVWLGSTNALMNLNGSGIFSFLCPNGDGALVPCSNGGMIRREHLLERVANSYSNIAGNYPAAPNVRISGRPADSGNVQVINVECDSPCI